MGGGASAVRDPWALVGSHPSAVCVRASVPVTPWETSRIAEKTRAALPDPWSPAPITRVAPDRRQQVGTATSRRRNCRLRPPFKGVMRWRMKDPPNLRRLAKIIYPIVCLEPLGNPGFLSHRRIGYCGEPP